MGKNVFYYLEQILGIEGALEYKCNDIIYIIYQSVVYITVTSR